MSRSLNLSNSELIEKSVANNESELTHTGALLTLTGNRTGRSPKDRYIVEESSTKDKIDWGEVNRPFDSNHFDKLWNKVSAYLDDKDHYVSNVHVGSNKDHYIPVEVKSELAWHSLFSKLIFISPSDFNEENKEGIDSRLYNAKEELDKKDQFQETSILTPKEKKEIKNNSSTEKANAGVIEAASIVVGSLKTKLNTAQKELEQIQGLLEEEREAHKKTRQELMKIKSEKE